MAKFPGPNSNPNPNPNPNPQVLNHNSLEQFLINVANEQLNDYFQALILTATLSTHSTPSFSGSCVLHERQG